MLTLAGIAVGVAAAVASWTSIETVRGNYHDLFVGLAGQSALEVYSPGDAGFDRIIAAELAGIEGVHVAHPEVQNIASLRWLKIPMPVAVIGRASGGDGPVPSDGEVLVAQGLARSQCLNPGDRVPFWGPAGPVELTVAGTLPPPAIPGPADSLMAVVSLGDAQKLFALGGQINRVRLILDDSRDRAVVEEDVARRLPPGVSVRAPWLQSQTTRNLQSAALHGLTGLAAIALAGATYLVFGVIQLNLAMRRQEFAVLRSLGASASQVFGIIIRQSLLLGATGAILGMSLAYLLTWVMALVAKLATGVLISEPQVGWVQVALGFGVGLATSVGASWHPARTLCRSPALSLFQADPGPGRSASTSYWLRPGAWFGLALSLWILADCASCRMDATIGKLLFAPALGLALLSAIALIAPLWPWSLRRMERPLARAGGIELLLAIRHLGRRPDRTVQTFGLVFLVTTMSIGFGVTVENTLADVRAWSERAIPSDFLLRGSMPDPSFVLTAAIPELLGPQLAVLGGIESVDRIVFLQTAVNGEPALALVRTFGPNRPLPLDLRGSDEDAIRRGLFAGEAVLGEGLARQLDARVGDFALIEAPDGSRRVRVAGVVSEYAAGGSALYLEWSAGQPLFRINGVHAFLVVARPGEKERVAERLAAFCAARGLLLQQNSDIQNVIAGLTRGLTAGLWCLLVVIFLVAGLGVMNALALNAWEQSRNIEVLRAVGMVSVRVRAMFRWQALVLVVLSVPSGVLAGVVLAKLLNRVVAGLWGYRVPFEMDWRLILVVVSAAGVMGLLSGLIHEVRSTLPSTATEASSRFPSAPGRRSPHP
jgi:putative ABC transport system permease protein